MTYYETNPQRLGLLGHFSFGVKAMSVAEPFYTAALAAFDIDRVYADNADVTKAKVVGYGKGEREPFCLFEDAGARAHGKRTHLAFNAPDRKAVDEFYAAALRAGGKGDGPPGLRLEVGKNYYCCFVFDPFGHRLEAVFQQEPEQGSS